MNISPSGDTIELMGQILLCGDQSGTQSIHTASYLAGLCVRDWFLCVLLIFGVLQESRKQLRAFESSARDCIVCSHRMLRAH